MSIDLFRPFVAPGAVTSVERTLTPDADGRVYLGEGPRVQEFERGFQRLVGTEKSPLALNSGTSALELALHLAGVGPGDEVISTPMTCTATNGAIVRCGATIVWADVDPFTGNIAPLDVTRKVSARTAAIVAVDWGGRACDYAALRRTTTPIIQDAAHTLMVDVEHNRGDYVCWSFQAIKHLTTGDGGALLPPDYQYDRAKLLRWYGLDRSSSADFRCSQDITEVGFKMHMNDVAASIGLANIPHMQRVVARHRANADWYHNALRGAPGIVLPPPDPKSSWWLYTLLVDDRDSLKAFLAERGIASSPVHRRNDEHTAFKRYSREPLPGVDFFASRALAIPVGWWVSDAERETVASAVLEWAHTRVEVKVAA